MRNLGILLPCEQEWDIRQVAFSQGEPEYPTINKLKKLNYHVYEI